MARTPNTPVHAQKQAKAHARICEDAAATIVAIVDGTWLGADADRQSTLHACAKQLESAGCYIRRQNSNAMLVP